MRLELSTKRLLWCLGFAGCLQLLVCTPAHAAAARSSLDDKEAREDASELVEQLGDKSFQNRQRAAKELARIGIAAEPALVEALQSGDIEIRTRAAQVLSRVREVDFQARLEAFAADISGRAGHDLPAWDPFRALMGSSRTARSLFVEMQRAEPALLEALESGDKLANALFTRRCQAILQRMQVNNFQFGVVGRTRISRGTVAALLFVGAAANVKVDEQVAVQLYNFILQPAFQEGLKSGVLGPPLKKLLAKWMLKNNGPSVAFQNLMLALSLELKESVDLAVQMLEPEAQHAQAGPVARAAHRGTTHYALLAIGKFGTKEHLPLVEKYLGDATLCETRRSATRQIGTQIRDVALAVAVHLTGQKLQDYDFRQAQASPQILYQPGTLGFIDQATRDGALKKWAEWRKQHPG